MIQKRLILKGRVQDIEDDIDYREKIKDIARDMKILGEVRNIRNGTVEILCECKDEKQLSDFKKKITIKEQSHHKPCVEKIDEYPFEGKLTVFTVEYNKNNMELELLKATTRWVNAAKSLSETKSNENKKWRVDDDPDDIEGRSYHVMYKKHIQKKVNK